MMDLKAAFQKIDKYLDSDDNTPIIIDVPEIHLLDSIRNKYEVGSNVFDDASSFCKQDTLPQMDKMYNELHKRRKKVFLTGLSTYLKLQGEETISQTLKSILDINLEGKLVVITYRSSRFLRFDDPRPKSSGKVIIIDSSTEYHLPSLVFVSPELSDSFDIIADGIQDLSKFVEFPLDIDLSELPVKTRKKRSDFPNSLFAIRSFSSSFEMIAKAVHEISNLNSNYGTEEQWAYLRSKLDKYGDWMSFVTKEFGGANNLVHNISNFVHYSDAQKWSYFIALRICGAPETKYLSSVINASSDIQDFFDRLYTLILTVEPRSKDFVALYKERRDVLSKITIPLEIVSDFCKQVRGKGKDALYYLTDSTQLEKELALEVIDEYYEQFDCKQLNSIFRMVYPDLAIYLTPYNFRNELLNRYFGLYKYCKVINHISPEHMSIVEEQSLKREYNSILQPRTSVLSRINITGTKLYFVDALGCEFLSYIQDKLYRHNLDCHIELARCELPSITSMNKDFVQIFHDAGCPVVDIKKLDSLKHEGTSRYNYENTKLPIHIIEEFAIIDELIRVIAENLSSDNTQRVFVISDHGASRLAVINEKENKWEISEKGKHSGRCCPKSEIDEKPDAATEDNDYWCLANYDRFRGGRKASVEVHGGASLEEVIVPIIEIKRAGEKPKCLIDEDYKVVTASFKITAKIRLFIAKDTKDIKVCLNGKYFDAVPSEQNFYYEVPLPGIRKKGKYTIDVYEGNTLIAQGLTFEVKSAGVSENRYF